MDNPNEKSEENKDSIDAAKQVDSSVFLERDDAKADHSGQMEWYMVHVQSGKEFVAKTALEKYIASEGFTKIEEVVVPVYSETVYKNGKKKSVEKRSYPGYMCLRMFYDMESKACVCAMPYVSGFVSQGGVDPQPLSEREVKSMLVKDAEEVSALEPMSLDFDVGQKVLIVDGPFNNFSGNVTALFPEKGKVSVNIEIFGRETPIEIDYYKVKKH